MQTNWIFGSAVELALCFLLSVVVTWMGFRATTASTPDLDDVDELRKGNVAVAIVLAAMLASSGLVLREAVYPVVATLRTFMSADTGVEGWIQWLGHAAAFLLGACFTAVVGLVLGVRLFTAMTPELDEAAEVRRGNVAVAIVVGTVILVVGMFIGQGVGSLLEAVMPWGDLPTVVEPR